jgi:hypothetical protein
MSESNEVPFVHPEFVIPPPPRGDGYLLTPLLLEHNEGDLEAWSSSVQHIHTTPGFEGHPWPNEPMTLERNREDLKGHVDDFARRQGFTYSVQRDSGGAVLGCVYIYPSQGPGVDAHVRSWVRASAAELDPLVHRTVSEWLLNDWPFESVDYAPRPGAEPRSTAST